MDKELAKTLTTALVQFIDRERPEDTMCCSNGICVALEKAFINNDFDRIEELVKYKLSGLTEFEEEVADIVEYCKEHGDAVAFDYAQRHSKSLLALAKKQLLSYADESNPAIEAMADLERTYFCNPDKLPKWLKDDIARKELNAHTKGYNKGYKDAEKQYNESVAYHFPIMPTPPSGWGCDGTHCTNPHMDCINCPIKTTGGLNTSSGTSTAKVKG